MRCYVTCDVMMEAITNDDPVVLRDILTSEYGSMYVSVCPDLLLISISKNSLKCIDEVLTHFSKVFAERQSIFKYLHQMLEPSIHAREDILAKLFRYKFSMEETDINGNTVLYNALALNMNSYAEKLLQYGANPHARSKDHPFGTILSRLKMSHPEGVAMLRVYGAESD